MLFDLSPSPSLRECKFRAFVWFKFKGTGNFFLRNEVTDVGGQRNMGHFFVV